MLLVLTVLGAAVLCSLAAGGRLRRAARAPVRAPGLLLAGLAVPVATEVLVRSGILEGPGALTTAAHVLGQVLVLAFVAANWVVPGSGLLGIGLLCNLVVLAANGAMPIGPGAIRALGVEVPAALASSRHVLAGEGTRLAWLGDVVPIPPLRTIVSVGDVLASLGLARAVHAMMTHRAPAERRGGARTGDEREDLVLPDHDTSG